MLKLAGKSIICMVVTIGGAFAAIQRAADLNCDFQGPCLWRNGTNNIEDDFDWMTANSVVLDSWHSIPRSRSGSSTDYFAYVRGSHSFGADDNAILISDTIPCQDGTGNLNFWFWKTALVMSLQICTRQPPGPHGAVKCFERIRGLHRQEWVEKSVAVPPENVPFEILFKAAFQLHVDIIGLDDITYDAVLCQPPVGTLLAQQVDATNSQTNFPVGGPIFPTQASRPPLATPTVGITTGAAGSCAPTNCNFDSGNFCSYNPGKLETGVMRTWQVSNKKVGNSLTGIFKDTSGNGSYLFAGGQDLKKTESFALESPLFTTSMESQLQLNYFLAGIEGRLRVCLDSVSNCPFSAVGNNIKQDSREWKPAQIQVPAGQHKILYVADQLTKNYVIGLDDLNLLTSGASLSTPANFASCV